MKKARWLGGLGVAMEPWAIALLLKPLYLLVLFVLVLYPARWAVQKYMRDGRLKRLLLWRVTK
jgi:hypothetical protein